MPTAEYRDFQQAMLGQIQSGLNVDSDTHRLEASNVAIDKPLDPNDLARIKKARLRGQSFADKIFADLKLTDRATGRVISEKRVHVADIPIQTPFKTYLVDGAHYQAKNQAQLKGTVYTEVTGPGDVVSSFRPERGRNFKLKFNPEDEKFEVQVKNSHIPLYPIMKTLGVSDQKLKKEWGASIFNKNSKLSDHKYVKKFADKVFGPYRVRDKSEKEIDDMVINHFNKESRLHPEATQLTLGKPYENITSDALMAASGKILDIHKGKAEPDRKDEIYFKRVRGLDVTAKEFLESKLPSIQRKIKYKLDGERTVDEIVPLTMFKKPMKWIFTKTRLQGAGETTNIVDIMSENSKVTTMGEGGITDTHKISKMARDVQASALGFLDPVKTSAGTAGITEHLALGASVKGTEIYAKMLETKSGKIVEVTPGDLFGKVVAFPDENGPIVRAVRDGQIISVKPSEVDYRITDPRMMFSEVTNLIPFIQNNSGGRAIFGAAQITQAVSLKDREVPLVQAATDWTKKKSFDDVVGRKSAIISPVSGTILSIGKKGVKVRGDGGGSVLIPLPDNLPLNQDSFIDAEPLVVKGDVIVKGQVVADTNNTKNGTLAIGKNLLTAVMPWKGYSFEDGVVLSGKASGKLVSEHLREKGAKLNRHSQVSLDSFTAYAGSGRHKMSYKNEQKIDPKTGLIKKGVIVEPGETMAAILRKREDDPEMKLLGILTRSKVGKLRADPIVWDRDVPGEVVDVEQTPKEIRIMVKTKESAKLGDKLATRHGGKGVITHIIPDSEMPVRKSDGRPIDMIIEPSSIAGRVNPGQILEMAAGKIAEKTGKPYLVNNFEPGVNYTERLAKELVEHGLPDKEDVYDPESGRTIPSINIGPKYVHKLEHQVENKFKARTPGQGYNLDRAPTDGRTIDKLTFYALAAHGAKKNLREMATLKAERNPEIWATYDAGGKLTLPQEAPFTWKKMEAMMKGMGVNLDRKGSQMMLIPLTDKETLSMSNGQITSIDVVRKKDMKPIKGGIFDWETTGGPTEEGKYWTHIKLPEPVLNKTFKKATASVLGMTEIDLDRVSKGEKKLNNKTGGPAIKAALDSIDVTEELKKANEAAKTATRTGKDKINRKIRVLSALDRFGMSPSEAYMMNNVPVIPPSMRLIRELPDGTKSVPDINYLYQDLATLALQSYPDAKIYGTQETQKEVVGQIYEAAGAIAGLNEPVNQSMREARGFLKQLTGKPSKQQEMKGITRGPKFGYLQRKIMRKGQDLTTGGTIVADPTLEADEIGMPEDMAWELYKPMIVRGLRVRGMSGKEAVKRWKERDLMAKDLLLKEMDSRPVFWNRAPAWHRYNMIAARPVLRTGKAIRTSNLPITSFQSADFDGDTISMHVPITDEAVEEAKTLMPSKMFMRTLGGGYTHAEAGGSLSGGSVAIVEKW